MRWCKRKIKDSEKHYTILFLNNIRIFYFHNLASYIHNKMITQYQQANIPTTKVFITQYHYI